MRYFGLDGDSIGRQIELLLIQNKVEDVKKFSNSIVKALDKIYTDVIKGKGEVIFCSGDSILFYGDFENEFVEKILTEFRSTTGKSASIGIGNNVSKTYLGLKLAKAKGGNQIVEYNEIEKI